MMLIDFQLPACISLEDGLHRLSRGVWYYLGGVARDREGDVVNFQAKTTAISCTYHVVDISALGSGF